MAKRKKKKNRKSGKWKILVLLVIIALTVYYYFGYSNYDVKRITKNIDIENAIDTAVDGVGKVKDKIVNKATGEETNERDKIQLGLEIPKYASSISDKEIILKRKGYTASYNTFYKNPNWVAWELTREETKGKADRADRFVPDPDLPEPRALHSDYTRSGYDRGHMAPAADMKWSKAAMDESFYMSNICPQVGNLNRGDWNDLEEICRGWAAKYGTVYIACGPVFNNKRPKRIGKNKVGVPERFFKVVLVYNRKNPMAMGFLFNNKAGSKDLKNYMVTVDSIENITGLDFFYKLPDGIERKIEAEIPTVPLGDK